MLGFLVTCTPLSQSQAMALQSSFARAAYLPLHRSVLGESTDVRAWISAFQNTKRTETVPKPDLGVIILRSTVASRCTCFYGPLL